MKIKIGPNIKLKIEDVVNVSKQGFLVEFDKNTKQIVDKSRSHVEKIIKEHHAVYGINTGFGSLKSIKISDEELDQLQVNLIRSHSCGVGTPFSLEEVRAMMLVRLNSLIKGYSGVRFELVELVRNMLNKDIVPYVPSQGSVGASGDLAPLCHMGLSLIGEGKAYYKGKLMDSGEALKLAKLKPIEFKAKEGLAWSNGTSVMTGLSALTIAEAKNIEKWADISCALSFEALRGCANALDKRIHLVRGQVGQIEVAKNLQDLLHGSKLVNSEPERIQDSYTLRCSPQVHGACRDVLRYVKNVIDIEINAVTDNPLVFGSNQIISGGNFHGEPVAIAMDSLAIGISEFGSISERRTAKLVDPATNHGLPAFLVDEKSAGTRSGLMIPQYAAAALVSENKVLSHPASVDSIPTSANQEDHVSMGTISARKIRNICQNTKNVLAVEILNACQAIGFLDDKKMSPKTREIYKKVRKVVPFASEDRIFSYDIEAISKKIIV